MVGLSLINKSEGLDTNNQCKLLRTKIICCYDSHLPESQPSSLM